MRQYSHAKAGPAISTQSRKERRVRKGATALESRKPTSAKDRLRRFAARSRRHGREQVPAMSRSHAAHFVSFALPDTERASCPTRKRASPFTERFRVNKFLVPGFWFRDIGFAAKRLATSFICYLRRPAAASPTRGRRRRRRCSSRGASPVGWRGWRRAMRPRRCRGGR